ncbi:hypothetical protein A3750_14280 [Oleiphilus sp. HI0079]|uniref:hypothetical protein n=1 Tax=Oleiphilus sp. HI0079 TaxID=1822254 RepID=UPI0007C2B8DF|nr:hypothetical protein [Oleiphilus sp. HI0079]KZZ14537.1 hypothetical protein A3750_14280 [Oleiphilus sp. HI0079]
MSRWDEFDRMQERVEEGIQKIKDNTERFNQVAGYLSDEQKKKWNLQKSSILDQIKDGKTFGDDWSLNGAWVDLPGKRMFKVPDDLLRINEERVKAFLRAHKVHLTKSEIKDLTGMVFSMSDDEAKSRLKAIIIKYRTTGRLELVR